MVCAPAEKQKKMADIATLILVIVGFFRFSELAGAGAEGLRNASQAPHG
jgi:hypothetical protein